VAGDEENYGLADAFACIAGMGTAHDDWVGPWVALGSRGKRDEGRGAGGGDGDGEGDRT